MNKKNILRRTVTFFVLAGLMFSYSSANSQNMTNDNGLQVQTSRYSDGSYFVSVSLNNLLKLITMNFSDFNELMDKYNYRQLESDESTFISNNGNTVDDGIMSISKDIGYVAFVWTENSSMISNLKDELQNYYKGERDQRGYTIYRISYHGDNYKITLLSSSVIIQRVQ